MAGRPAGSHRPGRAGRPDRRPLGQRAAPAAATATAAAAACVIQYLKPILKTLQVADSFLTHCKEPVRCHLNRLKNRLLSRLSLSLSLSIDIYFTIVAAVYGCFRLPSFRNRCFQSWEHGVCGAAVQSWALEVFLNFFNNNN